MGPLERAISLDTEIPIDEESKDYKGLHRLNYSGKLESIEAGNVRIKKQQGRSCNRCCREKAISIILRMSVCSFMYPACSAHAPYCRHWPVRLYNYLKKGRIFEKKKRLLSTKCVFCHSTTFV